MWTSDGGAGVTIGSPPGGLEVRLDGEPVDFALYCWRLPGVVSIGCDVPGTSGRRVRAGPLAGGCIPPGDDTSVRPLPFATGILYTLQRARRPLALVLLSACGHLLTSIRRGGSWGYAAGYLPVPIAYPLKLPPIHADDCTALKGAKIDYDHDPAHLVSESGISTTASHASATRMYVPLHTNPEFPPRPIRFPAAAPCDDWPPSSRFEGPLGTKRLSWRTRSAGASTLHRTDPSDVGTLRDRVYGMGVLACAAVVPTYIRVRWTCSGAGMLRWSRIRTRAATVLNEDLGQDGDLAALHFQPRGSRALAHYHRTLPEVTATRTPADDAQFAHPPHRRMEERRSGAEEARRRGAIAGTPQSSRRSLAVRCWHRPNGAHGDGDGHRGTMVEYAARTWAVWQGAGISGSAPVHAPGSGAALIKCAAVPHRCVVRQRCGGVSLTTALSYAFDMFDASRHCALFRVSDGCQTISALGSTDSVTPRALPTRLPRSCSSCLPDLRQASSSTAQG
ncbi:hypothetical protein OH77DRAFT_93599 [Trametes cingulata]|nr:hypothetical protein OH77DRAFT_93599 [Trametes cingulata]